MSTPTTEADKVPAHTLWVELSTRITTQRLHYRSGEEETAAKSIFDIFALTRTLMEKNPDAHAFESLALKLLNEALRPYTARWHGWMTADKELRDAQGKSVLKFRDEWVRRQFRKELRELQPRIIGYREAFAAMKDGRQPKEEWTQAVLDAATAAEFRQMVPGEGVALLGGDLPAGIQDQVRFAGVKPAEGRQPAELQKQLIDAINQAEHGEIQKKRGKAANEPLRNATGIAFSGGGIRSATFCLGITQVLAQRGLLTKFDYLSTVSGGGYFGSFLSAYLGTGEREKPAGSAEEEAKARIEETFEAGADQREPRAIRHLRNRSRYLLDGDFWNMVAEIGMVVAGVLFNLLIVLPFPIIAALLTKALSHAGYFGQHVGVGKDDRWLPAPDALASVLLMGALGLLAIVVLVFPIVKARALKTLRETRQSKAVERWKICHKWAFIAALGLLLLWLTPIGFRLYHAVRTFEPFGWLKGHSIALSGEAVAGIATVITTIFAAWQAKKGKGGGSGKLAKLAILAGPVLYAVVYLGVGYRLMVATAGDHWPWETVAIVTAALLAWAWLVVDVNTYSPHGYYRDRLAECYIQSRAKADPASDGNRVTVPVVTPRLRLAELNTASTAAPYHLVNATVNLPSSKVLELRGRAADFFVFSKHWSGGPVCGYFPTKDLEEADPHLDLGTALAISGAAASSNMGWMTNNRLRLVMTLANIRLGYWMRNPAFGKEKAKKFKAPGPGYLFREMFARGMDEKQKFLNLSDGAHIENLGAYELLRRRCKFIVCVDGGMETDMHCTDLLRLERLASIDLGIRMHYDLTDVTLLPNGRTRAYGVIVKIDYHPPESEAAREARRPETAEWGWMLYLKLATTGTEPGFVMDYQRQNPAFPHQSTGDQIYEEGQFEAYRALGEFAATTMFRDELVEGKPVDTLENWFRALASALLPDNDEAFARDAGRPAPTNAPASLQPTIQRPV